MAPTKDTSLCHQGMPAMGGILPPGRCVLPPVCTAPHLVACKTCVLGTMPRVPETLAGSTEAGRLERLQGTHRGQLPLRPFALSSCSFWLPVAGLKPQRHSW